MADLQTAIEKKDRTLFRAEWVIFLIGIIAWIFLKRDYLYTLLINSDEPQHLHVVWGWTQGHIHYKEFFDNHAPLFYIVFAPVLKWFGERPDILEPMRLVMIPLCLACLGLVYQITARLYSHRAAAWAALFTALHPLYFLVSTEFRTDNFWAFVWLATLSVFLSGELTKKRAFFGGLLLGATVATSLKTTLLGTSLLVGTLIVLLARAYSLGRSDWKLAFKGCLGITLSILAGLVIIPGLLVGYFAYHDALAEAHYCIFQHNLLPELHRRNHFPLWKFFLIFAALLAGGWLFYHSAKTAALSARRAIAFFSGTLAFLFLVAFWPLVTRQDFCSILPPVMISAAPAAMAFTRWIVGSCTARSPHRLAWVGLAIALALPSLYLYSEISGTRSIWRSDEDQLADFAGDLQRKLLLTGPEDYIMDGKGETIFRRRPHYYVLERVTLDRMKLGYLKDTIQEDCVSKNTGVISTFRMADHHRNWLTQGYLPIKKSLWVAGRLLPEAASAGIARPFKLMVSGEYNILSEDETPVTGTLDGKPITSPLFLEAGEHTLIADQPARIAVVWSKAAKIRFSPFKEGALADKKRKDPNEQRTISTNPFETKKDREKKKSSR